MTVAVRLFAVLRERVGSNSIEVELDDGATVAEALARLAERPELGDLLDRMPVAMAVNRDYADGGTSLAPGDELALVPPISGGAPMRTCTRGSPRAAAPRALCAWSPCPGAGAIVSFQGTTREVTRLGLRGLPGDGEEMIRAILHDCVDRYGLEAVAADHRVGPVALGESVSIVAVSAAHRAEAFAGAREAIDRIKAEAPIWKREVVATADGERGRWVEERHRHRRLRSRHDERRLTHPDDSGSARMVDVGGKETTESRAIAEAQVRMLARDRGCGRARQRPKGDVIGAARLAGIQAAKRTGELIPPHTRCRYLHRHRGAGSFADGSVVLNAEATTVGRTGSRWRP